MLDEAEFTEIALLYSESMKGIKRFREASGTEMKNPSIHEFFRPVRDKYEQLSGMKESNENAILDHRISLYGPPCSRCGKPLRTPKAKLCGNCMSPADRTDS